MRHEPTVTVIVRDLVHRVVLGHRCPYSGEMSFVQKESAFARASAIKSKRSPNGGREAKANVSEAQASKVRSGENVVLLSGGNPQIAKADGDGPVRAYLAAMPGWKSDLGKRLDTLIVRNVPNVGKAVKWNSPFYGFAGQGWFLSFHGFTRYVKVTFFRGTSLRPVPRGGTVRSKEARWVDVHEGDELDEAQFAAWVK